MRQSKCRHGADYVPRLVILFFALSAFASAASERVIYTFTGGADGA
jgi:hypothetical protein